MFTYPAIDPVIFSIGPVAVRWYGLMYLIGIIGGLLLLRRRARRDDVPFTPSQAEDIVFYTAVGVILGGRLGSILFYSFRDFLADPLMMLRIWEGGMSYHGGMIGVAVAMGFYARRHARNFFQLTDFITPVVPIGLGAGRIGNFINNELWGKPVSADFPLSFRVGDQVLHPSQLYEAFLEGLVIFVVLYTFSARPRPLMAVSGLFSLLYGVFRCLVEFVRVPDQHIGDGGYLAFGWLTMGQVLSAPLVVLGVVLLVLAYRRPSAAASATHA